VVDLPFAPGNPGGWSPEDFEWETRQESAAACLAANDRAGAARLWAEALFLARKHFANNDARLATSIANHAVGLCWSGDPASADALFAEAQRVWTASVRWLESLRPERRARSSLYHLRMEGRHRRTYDQLALERLKQHWESGKLALAALGRSEPSDRRPVDDWRREKPPTLSDPRKLIAAVCLMAVRPG
jgi:hypothetical protein